MAETLAEPRTMSYAAVWCIAGSTTTFVVAVLPGLFGVPHTLATLGATVLGLATASAATRVIRASELFADRDKVWKDRAAGWLRVGVALHCGWMLLYATHPGEWFGLLLLLILLGLVEYGFCRSHTYLLTARTVPDTGDELRTDDELTRWFTAVLHRARIMHLTVLGWEPIPHGKRFVVRSTFDVGKKATLRLTPDDAEAIAVVLSEVMPIVLHSDWVQIRKLPAAGTHAVTVTTRDVMAAVRPYIDDPTPTSSKTPTLVGWAHDGQPVFLLLRAHGREVGKTDSGKSSLVNVQFAFLTRCTDAVVWVGATEKLYDMVGEWLDPYMDTDDPLPFGYFANGPRDLLDMLIAAMNIVRWRQAVPIRQRLDWCAVIIKVDEFSFAARNRSVRGVYQGQTVTISEISAMLAQAGASARVYLQTCSQRSTNDHGGDSGADIFANGGYTAGFMSQDWAEVGRAMGNAYFQLPPPTHRGEYWLTTQDGPTLVKAPYIQSADTSKDRLHDGATIGAVSLARRHIRRELDPGSAAAAGDAYARRHVRMNDELERYLTSAESTTDSPEVADPARAGYDEVMAEYAHLLGREPEVQVTPVATLEGRRPRAERITEILRDAGGPMTPAEIVTALREGGDETVGDQVVANTLSRLVTDGRATRPGRGQYAHDPTTAGDLTFNS